jgi:hypothetical protein
MALRKEYSTDRLVCRCITSGRTEVKQDDQLSSGWGNGFESMGTGPINVNNDCN